MLYEIRIDKETNKAYYQGVASGKLDIIFLTEKYVILREAGSTGWVNSREGSTYTNSQYIAMDVHKILNTKHYIIIYAQDRTENTPSINYKPTRKFSYNESIVKEINNLYDLRCQPLDKPFVPKEWEDAAKAQEQLMEQMFGDSKKFKDVKNE